MGKCLFKIFNEDTGTKSTGTALVSLLLTWTRYFAHWFHQVKECTYLRILSSDDVLWTSLSFSSFSSSLSYKWKIWPKKSFSYTKNLKASRQIILVKKSVFNCIQKWVVLVFNASFGLKGIKCFRSSRQYESLKLQQDCIYEEVLLFSTKSWSFFGIPVNLQTILDKILLKLKNFHSTQVK